MPYILPQVQLKCWNCLIVDQDSQKRTISEENQMNASHRFLCQLSFYKTDLQDNIHCKHLILTRIKLPITLIIFVGLGKFKSLHWDVATPTDSCTRVPGVLPRVLLMDCTGASLLRSLGAANKMSQLHLGVRILITTLLLFCAVKGK